MGGCQYILAKDCVNNTFTVLVDNVKCGSGGTVSCTKNVYVYLNGTIITLRGGGTVTIDGNKVPDFPTVASSKEIIGIFWTHVETVENPSFLPSFIHSYIHSFIHSFIN